MNQRKPECPENIESPEYEKEISIIELIKILMRWKWLISGGTALCVIAAVAVSFSLPKIYEISMIVESGVIGRDNRGYFIPIDSPESVAAKIAKGAYARKIAEAIAVDPKEAEIEFDATADRKGTSPAVYITSEWKAQDIETGIKATWSLIQCLQGEYADAVSNQKNEFNQMIKLKNDSLLKIEVQRKELEQQISAEGHAIQNIEEDINLEKAQLLNVERQISEYREESKSVKANTDSLVFQRDRLLQNAGATENNLSLLLYTTTIQQNIAYVSKIAERIYDLKKETKETEAKVVSLKKDMQDKEVNIQRLILQKNETLQTNIREILTEIERLKLNRDMITDVKIIQQPEVGAKSIKPNKQLVVVLAALAGIMFFSLLAFFLNACALKKSREEDN
ncbi:MAG: hypothetical protein JW884_00045 [Deltaproteobacteria bacterium]|nr:hypothetical protein [Deltaproteobacteria bacterium]